MALQTKTVSTGDYAWQSWSNGYMIHLTLTQLRTDIAANTSRVSYLFTVSNTDNNRFTSNDYSWTVSIGGQSIPIEGFDFALGSNHTTQTIASGEITVQHAADGTLDMPYSVSIPNVQSYNRYGPPAMTLSGTWTLVSIPRHATLVSAPNFTDEEAPVITYTNPAGENITTLQVCICNADGTEIYAAYRDIPKTGTGYTFQLTEQERRALQNATTDSNSRTVKFVLLSKVSGVTEYSQLFRTLSIVNAQPVLLAAVKDTNTVTVALTGDANKLVRFYSNATATADTAGQKGAMVKHYTVASGGKLSYSTPSTFYRVESGEFLFSVTDSRGNKTSLTVQKPLVEYVKLTCNLHDNKPDTDGDMTLSVSGSYFNGSFGAKSNTLTVQYRYKVSGGSYGDWVTLTPVLSGDTYHAEATLTGLDYQTAYTFQARAIDRLAEVASSEYTARALPVFDWSEQDFNVNGTFRINSRAVADYVVEQGTEENWTYRKWASGLAECWTTIANPQDPTDPTRENIYFPLYFKGNPVLHTTFNMGEVAPPVLVVPLFIGLGFFPPYDENGEITNPDVIASADYAVCGITPANEEDIVSLPDGITMNVYATGRWM